MKQRREFLELDRRGFGVVLPAFWQRLLVIPDFARRAGAVEEQQIRRDAGVGREHAVRQPDDGVQVEFLEQFFFDAGAHAIAKQRAVGTRPRRRAPSLAAHRDEPQFPHDELQEKQRGFRRLLVFREIALDALLLLAAKGRVGQDHIHAVSLADVGELEPKRIAGINLRSVEAVQQQVHLAEQIRQRLGFAAEQGFLLQDLAVGHGLDLLGKVLERLDQKAARAAAGSSTVSPRRGSVTVTISRTTARGV